MDVESPFSGKVFNTYASGKREYEGKYNNGRPNGSLVYWYENGNKMREGILRDGQPVGRWTTYWEDGRLKDVIDH